MLIHFSNPIKKSELEEAYKKGMIRKKDLKHCHYYKGYCRNSSMAMWNSYENCFFYLRTKFNQTFSEGIRHPEDDDGLDLFIPLKEIE